MNKAFKLVLAFLIFAAVCNFSVFAANSTQKIPEDNKNIWITVDGKKITLQDADKNTVYAKVLNDRTFIPVRAVSENLNGKVLYNEEKRKVQISCNNRAIVFIIDKEYYDTANVENEIIKPEEINKKFEVPPFEMGGTTYLPIRAYADEMNLNINWVEETQHISIVTEDKSEFIKVNVIQGFDKIILPVKPLEIEDKTVPEFSFCSGEVLTLSEPEQNKAWVWYSDKTPNDKNIIKNDKGEIVKVEFKTPPLTENITIDQEDAYIVTIFEAASKDAKKQDKTILKNGKVDERLLNEELLNNKGLGYKGGSANEIKLFTKDTLVTENLNIDVIRKTIEITKTDGTKEFIYDFSDNEKIYDTLVGRSFQYGETTISDGKIPKGEKIELLEIEIKKSNED